LNTSESKFPIWTTECPIHIDQGTEYKLIILQHDGRVWWEVDENRVLPESIPSGSTVSIVAHFERPILTTSKVTRSIVPSLKITDWSVEKLRTVFDLVDSKKVGKINRRDLIKAVRESKELTELFGLPASLRQEDGTREALENVFQGMDTNGTREVTWPQFYFFFSGLTVGLSSPEPCSALDTSSFQHPTTPVKQGTPPGTPRSPIKVSFVRHKSMAFPVPRALSVTRAARAKRFVHAQKQEPRQLPTIEKIEMISSQGASKLIGA